MRKEETYQELKKRIIDEELAPGQWLVEKDISDDFGISRTPVREIFRRLVSDGLLELKPTKGYLVRKLNLEEIVEIFQAREAVEGMAARLCCLRGDVDFFSRIDELREMFEQIDIEKDTTLGVITGRELHDTIVDAAGNALLSEFYQKLRNLAMLTRNITKKSIEIESKSKEFHLAITKAVQEKDELKTEHCMREHLSTTCRMLVESYLVNKAGFMKVEN